jgi:HAD superfamily hydrolase (TIGR01509 family)
MRFAAIIFDLDGTIINSEKQWGLAFLKVLNMLGAKTDEDHHIRGFSIKSNWQEILTKYKIKPGKTLEELETLTYLEYAKLIPGIELNDGVLDFMDAISESGLPLALATSASWEITDKIINNFKLNDYFESVTTVEEVVNPKPAPDIFLLASEKLGIDPADCLVIEDSLPGITAAHEAGMRVVAINGSDEEAEELDGADLVVQGFSEITLKAIDSMGQD